MPPLRLSSLRGVMAVMCALVLTGCSSVGFYAQAVQGHMALMRARVPLDQALSGSALSEVERRKLEIAREARRYAVTELGLPDNGSYTSWVKLDRPAVTWNVVATQPYSMRPEQWCFPIAGCLSYRGYFERADADRYAASLADQGLDVAVNGSAAYSSLGWFEDPLVSTMMRGSDTSLVGVLFHELAHQQLYVSDDSSFNESFATFVELAGVEQWLRDADQAQQAAPWRAQRTRRDAFVALLADTRKRLTDVFSSGGEPAQLQAAKDAEYARLSRDYQSLKASWGGYSGYDSWFRRPVNNARLAGVGTYTQWVDAFAALFEQSGRDFHRFFESAAALGELPRAERRERLLALSPG